MAFRRNRRGNCWGSFERVIQASIRFNAVEQRAELAGLQVNRRNVSARFLTSGGRRPWQFVSTVLWTSSVAAITTIKLRDANWRARRWDPPGLRPLASQARATILGISTQGRWLCLPLRDKGPNPAERGTRGEHGQFGFVGTMRATKSRDYLPRRLPFTKGRFCLADAAVWDMTCWRSITARDGTPTQSSGGREFSDFPWPVWSEHRGPDTKTCSKRGKHTRNLLTTRPWSANYSPLGG